MNLIYYETKRSLKSSFIWTVSLITLFALMMLAAYPTYNSAVDEVTELLANYPPEFIAAFGMDIKNLFSYGGFYNFAFGYIGLVGAIMAASLSISVFAREKRSKCLDFLLTKPISRESIFIKKLISCLIILIITNLIYIILAMIMYQGSGDTSIDMGTFIFAIMGLFFTQLVFLSFGITFAVFSKKVRSVSGTATTFGFTAFILSAITNIFDDKNIDFIAPLKYFEPHNVFVSGNYDTKLVITAIIIVVFCIGISFVKYCKSDVYSV